MKINEKKLIQTLLYKYLCTNFNFPPKLMIDNQLITDEELCKTYFNDK